MFLKAEPVKTGTQRPSRVPWRRAARRSAALISSSPTNFSRIASSNSANTSINSARYCLANPTRSSGMSTSSHEAPRSSPCQTRAFISTRSTIPVKAPSAPMGSWTTAVLQPRRSRIVPSTKKKSAPVRSILLMKHIRGTRYRSAWRHTVSVWGSTPATPSNTATAPSRTLRDRSTSTVKSTWPGVSMMLTR